MKKSTLSALLIWAWCSCHIEACKPDLKVLENQTVAEGINETIRFSVIDHDNKCPQELKRTNINFLYIYDDGREVSSPCSMFLDPNDTSKYCNGTCSKTERGLDCALALVFYRNTTRLKLQATTGTNISDKIITVNVTYTTKVTQFISSSTEPVDVRSPNLLLHCDWAMGNPRRTVTIHGSHREVLNSSMSGHNDSHGQLTYTIKPVSCNSSGVYTCEVEEQPTVHNITVLVQCPPILTVANNDSLLTKAGGDVNVLYTLQSHTASLTSCNLTPPVSNRTHCSQTSYPCNSSKSSIKLVGMPPKFNLTLNIKNVAECDVGNWTLSITNDFNGTVDNLPNPAAAHFHVKKVETLTTEDLPSTSDIRNTDGSSEAAVTVKSITKTLTTAIIAAVAAVVVIVVIIITVVYIRAYRRKNYKDKNLRTTQANGGHPHETSDSEVIVNDVYATEVGTTSLAYHKGPKSTTASRVAGDDGQKYDNMQGIGAQPSGSHILAAGDMYVPMTDVKKLKGEQKLQKARKIGPSEADNEGLLYTDAGQVRKNKHEQKKVKKKTVLPPPHQDDDENTYHNVGHEKVSQASKGINASSTLKAGSGEGAARDDGLTYGQIDFSNFTPRGPVITPLPQTDYARIDFAKDKPSRPS